MLRFFPTALRKRKNWKPVVSRSRSTRRSINVKTKAKTKPVGKNPEQVFDDAVISAVLEKHLDLARTSKNQDAIRRKVGAGNYARLEEILAFASNQDVWLNAANLSSAADTVAGKLSQHYPGLSP